MKIDPKNILNKAEILQSTIVENRRYLHQIPEVHVNLPKTRKFVMDKLKEMGLEPKELGDGVVVNIGNPNKGKTILLRADMDALPIEEVVDIEFKSKNKAMHACGHDIHTSSLLGAAKILKEMEAEIHGNIKLMFQPGEETLTGAKQMIQAGVLEDPKVDAAMMIHVFTGLEIEPGTILIPKSGAASMAPDEFHINIQGKGGHGAMPQESVDPLNIAAHTHIALQELISREIKPGEKALCVVGKMAGGEASNVVPDTAKLVGCIRTMDKDTREFLKQRLVEVSQGVAKTFRGEATVEYTLECPSVVNDKEMRELGIKYSEELLGKENVKPLSLVMDGGMLNGSEDFAFLSEKVPSFMSMLSMGNPKDGYKYFHHNPNTKFDESMFYRGTAYYVYYALKWLEENNSL